MRHSIFLITRFYFSILSTRFTDHYHTCRARTIVYLLSRYLGFSRYLVGAPMPQDWFYNSPRNIYRAVSFKTRIWMGWTDFVAW